MSRILLKNRRRIPLKCARGCGKRIEPTEPLVVYLDEDDEVSFYHEKCWKPRKKKKVDSMWRPD